MNIIFNPSLDKHEADVSLLHAAQGGDQKAVTKLMKLLAPNAHALAWRMLNSSADAEDIVQDALVNPVRRQGELEYLFLQHRQQ